VVRGPQNGSAPHLLALLVFASVVVILWRKVLEAIYAIAASLETAA
jgi:hypothetical protein